MEDVTDTVFRQMVAKVGRPDVFFTEFTSVEGLDSPGSERVLRRLKFTERERPIVAQIWGREPQKYYAAARLIGELGFDGIDINMGCPQKDVVKKGVGIALCKNRNLAAEIIAATKEGTGDLPVSVKTRIGLKKIETEDWCGWLLSQGLAALTVHGRTAAEMSAVPAHWDEIGKVVQLRNQMFGGSGARPVIIGNGDVKDVLDARRSALESGVDGVMIGRGVLEDITAFSAQKKVLPADRDPALRDSTQERLGLLREHLRLWEETWGENKSFAVMKKYVKVYVRDFVGAAELRSNLMSCRTGDEMRKALDAIRPGR